MCLSSLTPPRPQPQNIESCRYEDVVQLLMTPLPHTEALTRSCNAECVCSLCVLSLLLFCSLALLLFGSLALLLFCSSALLFAWLPVLPVLPVFCHLCAHPLIHSHWLTLTHTHTHSHSLLRLFACRHIVLLHAGWLTAAGPTLSSACVEAFAGAFRFHCRCSSGKTRARLHPASCKWACSCLQAKTWAPTPAAPPPPTAEQPAQ